MNLDIIPKIDKAAAGITEGRVVHYQIETAPGVVACRPAIIVNAWRETGYERGEVNLTVFTDWSNDTRATGFETGDPLAWRTSVPHYEPNGAQGDRLPNTWHFPERT